MPTRPLEAEKVQAVKERIRLGQSQREISQKEGISPGSVSNIRATMKQEGSATPSESDETAGDTRTITIPKTTIKSLAELVEHCEIDLDQWEVERFICNKWEMGAKGPDEIHVTPLFQVKAFLKKRRWVEEAERVIERLRKKAERYSPSYINIKTIPSKSGNIAELSPVDVHHGALIWGKETGGDDYDLTCSVRCYKDAIGALMSRTAAYKPQAALLVFGHDQQNADNRGGSTENLTPQVNDSRYQKVADASCDASIWTVDQCLKEYGKVIVYMVPGNHDPLSTWHLGRVLAAWYRHTSKVQIHNSPNMRKYWEFGVNMLLLTHGNKGKLENYDKTMAAEQPAMWGRTLWREAHTGDKHHRRTLEFPGATVRILPSLRPSCTWSAENHYRSIRAAEGFVWNHDEGLIGQATYSILSGVNQ